MPSGLDAKALWDTGASKSVLSSRVVSALALSPVGKAEVFHAGGKSFSPTFVVNFILPNQVGIVGALVTQLGQEADGFDVIVGMDVICLGDFSITNLNGQTWMSFRTPSCSAIDYVSEFNRLQFAGVPRNAPCPCGKTSEQGKAVKFKHCHGA